MFWLKYYYDSYYSKSEEERPPVNILEWDLLFDKWLDTKRFQERNEEIKQRNKR